MLCNLPCPNFHLIKFSPKSIQLPKLNPNPAMFPEMLNDRWPGEHCQAGFRGHSWSFVRLAGCFLRLDCEFVSLLVACWISSRCHVQHAQRSDWRDVHQDASSNQRGEDDLASDFAFVFNYVPESPVIQKDLHLIWGQSSFISGGTVEQEDMPKDPKMNCWVTYDDEDAAKSHQA